MLFAETFPSLVDVMPAPRFATAVYSHKPPSSQPCRPIVAVEVLRTKTSLIEHIRPRTETTSTMTRPDLVRESVDPAPHVDEVLHTVNHRSKSGLPD